MIKALLTCCCPSQEDHYDDEGDERTRLIGNGGGGYAGNRWTGAYGAAGSGGSRDQRNGYTGNQADDDEQAILARILQDTANNVIDISTTDTHTVEPREYMERIRKYNQQLSGQIPAAVLQQSAVGGAASQLPASGSAGKRSSAGGSLSSGTGGGGSGVRCLLTDSSLTSSSGGGGTFATADKVLSSPGIATDDLLMVRQLTSEIAGIITGIHVDHKEDLVVQFAPA